MLIFPKEYVEVGNCIAVWATANGPRRIPGPITSHRPQIKYEGENWKASRLAWHLNCESIPRTPVSRKEGLILHTCDNAWCIKLEHLYKGTAQQNTIDIYERNTMIRGRQSEKLKGNERRKGKKMPEGFAEATAKRMIGNSFKLGLKENENTCKKKSLSRKKYLENNPDASAALRKGAEITNLKRWGKI